MSRRNISKKHFSKPDLVYNSYLISLLINRILKSGKKTLAHKLVQKTFNIIKLRTNQEPLFILEKAILNSSPLIKITAKNVKGSTCQVPVQINSFKATNLSLRWIIRFARERFGRTMAIKLANELIDASKGSGNSIKKKEETHRIAKSNKAFAHYRY
jgi:small subunit ribosomal protein S7